MDLKCLCEELLREGVGVREKNEGEFLNACTSYNEIKLVWLSLHWESGSIPKDKKVLSVECEPRALTWITTLKGEGLWLTFGLSLSPLSYMTYL